MLAADRKAYTCLYVPLAVAKDQKIAGKMQQHHTCVVNRVDERVLLGSWVVMGGGGGHLWSV